MDWHWDRIFAGAALTTLLGVGAELAAPENRQNGDRIIIVNRDLVLRPYQLLFFNRGTSR